MKNLILIFAIFVGSNLIGQENSPKTLADSLEDIEIDDVYMDFSIPKVTAFSLLNVDPSNILKPGVVKKFSMGVGTFADTSGTGKTGIAAEWSPFLTFSDSAIGWTKAFEPKNLLISYASVGNSLGGDMALAFRWAPIDFTNPLKTKEGQESIHYIIEGIRRKGGLSEKTKEDMMAFDAIYYNFIEKVASKNQNLDPNELDEKFEATLKITDSFVRDTLVEKYSRIVDDRNIDKLADTLKNDFELIMGSQFIKDMGVELDSIIDKAAELLLRFVFEENATKETFLNEMVDYKTNFKNKHWNKMAFEFGGGQILCSPNARFSELAANYNTFYLSFATPLMWDKTKNNESYKYGNFGRLLRDNSQLILHVRTQNYYAPDSTQNNSVFAGTRLLFGKSDWHISLECGYMSQANFVTGLDQSYLQYALGFDYRISDGNWIEFALGGAQTLSNTGRLELSLLPRIAFRHAFQKESRFD